MKKEEGGAVLVDAEDAALRIQAQRKAPITRPEKPRATLLNDRLPGVDPHQASRMTM
jgi:hypothetical protein